MAPFKTQEAASRRSSAIDLETSAWKVGSGGRI
jgi:hypothetical protein